MLFSATMASAQQDYHFSQFFASPITYNPANSGAFDADLRAAVNYRNQYGSIAEPYKTIAVAADAPLKLTNEVYDRNFLGLGLAVVSDNAGTPNFKTLHVAGSIAYAMDLGGTDNAPHFISVGLQFGLLQRSLDFTKASWETQWTGTSFDPGMASNEEYAGKMAETNLDLGAGISWYNTLSENSRILVGASMLHANAPKVEMIGSEEALMRKYTLHASLAVNMPDQDVTYYPNVLVMFQGPNRIIDIGSEIEFSLWDRTQYTDFRNNFSTNIGAYYRYKDAIYFIGRVNYFDFSLGISYDFTASKLSTNNNGQGGVEIVLGYRTRFTGPGTQRQKLIRSKGL